MMDVGWGLLIPSCSLVMYDFLASAIAASGL